MKIVFMGTPDFAVGALEAIIKAGHEVVAVVTQPDKPKGRGKEMQFPPVKECAVKYNVPVFQPVKVKTPESVEILRSYGAEMFVVAAFGQFLSKEILQMPKYGCINIHASLLPKYRGAAPIQWAVINGDKESGVTIMQMAEGIDTGDMLLKRAIPIEKKETGEGLYTKLSALGAELITEAISGIEAGTLTPEPQDDSLSCYAPKITKALGVIDWEKSAAEIERLIRGLNSWPSAYTLCKGKILKIWDADVTEAETDGEAGMVTEITKDSFCVNTSKGQLSIKQVQLEGKRRMPVKDFLLGCKLEVGEKLGE